MYALSSFVSADQRVLHSLFDAFAWSINVDDGFKVCLHRPKEDESIKNVLPFVGSPPAGLGLPGRLDNFPHPGLLRWHHNQAAAKAKENAVF